MDSRSTEVQEYISKLEQALKEISQLQPKNDAMLTNLENLQKAYQIAIKALELK